MEESKIVIQATSEVQEITIREGKSIDVKDPVKITLSGILNSPAKFLAAKKETFEAINCHAIVDHSKLSIVFIANEKDFYRTEVTGSLKPAKILDPFKINAEGKFKEKELAKILRRHPFLFDVKIKDQYDKLIASLLNFSAVVTTTIESNNDQRGNMKNLLEKSVEQRIPESIKFTAPIFEGEESLTFEVFICCEATSNAVEFYLDSPELYLLQESERKKLLGAQASIFEEFGCAVINV